MIHQSRHYILNKNKRWLLLKGNFLFGRIMTFDDDASDGIFLAPSSTIYGNVHQFESFSINLPALWAA